MVMHPELRSTTAVAGILRDVDQLVEHEGPLNPAAEVRTFKALHACAHLAHRKRGLAAHPAKKRRWSRDYHRLLSYLVRANLGLVYEMVRRVNVAGADRDAMMSEALFCLFQAVRGFDPWRGQRFSTYACTAISRGLHAVINREARRNRNLRRLFERLDRDEVDRAPAPETPSEVYGFVRNLLATAPGLTPTERSVLEYRYLQPRSTRPETLEAVGRCMNLSRERVRQIQEEALRKLRAAVDINPSLVEPFARLSDN
jgi:RNA polymerase sigma factor (sigma-70 family)